MSDFDRVKEVQPIKETVLTLTGLRMKGPHLERCPFCGHHDCFSFKDDGFRCFSCDAKGDIFNFLERYEGITPKEALERAASLAGIPLTRPEGPPSPARGEGKNAKDKIFAAATDYYHSRWLEGSSYFIEARKHGERTVGALRAGWSDGKLLDHLRGLGFTDEDILASGLVVVREKPDGKRLDDFFFKGLAVYPHYSQGRIVHFTCKDPAKKYELQLPKKHRAESWVCYNQDALYKRGELIIVEGENDLMSLFDAGFHNVIALCGNPSDERVKRIVSHCSSRHVYLCFDNDEGGRKYIRKFARALIAEGATVRIIVW
jgi:DNA primase